MALAVYAAVVAVFAYSGRRGHSAAVEALVLVALLAAQVGLGAVIGRLWALAVPLLLVPPLEALLDRKWSNGFGGLLATLMLSFGLSLAVLVPLVAVGVLAVERLGRRRSATG